MQTCNRQPGGELNGAPRFLLWRLLLVLLMVVSGGATSKSANENLADGVPAPLQRRLAIFDLRATAWIKAMMRARLLPGVVEPDLTFYVRSLSIVDSSGRVRFEFPEAPRLAVWLAPGDEVCGWTLISSTKIGSPANDGFATLRSPDGRRSIDLWEHLGVISFDRGPFPMPYERWVHHRDQLEAITNRGTHCLQVVKKPDHEPDDPWIEPADRKPTDFPELPPIVPDSPQIRLVRGRLQVGVGRRLEVDKPLPDVDFYVSDIDRTHKKATFRATATASVSVVAAVGDLVGGWTVGEFLTDPKDGAELGIELTPWVVNPNPKPASIQFWKRLEPLKPGEVRRLSQRSWERHQFEPDMDRLRAAGRIVVVPDSEKASMQPAK